MVDREVIWSFGKTGVKVFWINIIILSVNGSIVNTIGVHRITRPLIPVQIKEMLWSKLGLGEEMVELQSVDGIFRSGVGYFGSIMISFISVFSQTIQVEIIGEVIPVSVLISLSVPLIIVSGEKYYYIAGGF